MQRITLSPVARSLVAAAASLLTACADAGSLGPDQRDGSGASLATAAVTEARRGPDLGTCDSLRAPAGSKLVLRTFARGVQIYRWNGASWAFVAPEAALYRDAEARHALGTHYAGPTWESSRDGSTVVGAVAKRCTPDANAIPWLLLNATANTGHGAFGRVTSIQRVETAGGLAPAAPGSAVGQEARVPYTTWYYFYRAR